MRIVLGVCVAVGVLAAAAPSAAQTRAGAHRAATIGVRAYGILEGERMAAASSFKAVLGGNSAILMHVGVGGDLTGLWKGVFARVDWTHSSNTGGRVFVDTSRQVIPLGIPVTIEVSPLEVGAGWRFRPIRRGRVVPYIGGAAVRQHYQETSPGASADENVDVTDSGAAVFGGIEIGFKVVKIGLEAAYRAVPDALGAAGASQAFGETNLGGTVFRVSVGVGF
jgi:hypothetical protein